MCQSPTQLFTRPQFKNCPAGFLFLAAGFKKTHEFYFLMRLFISAEVKFFNLT